MIWRLASKGNISWRLASTELEASASTAFFDVASGVQRKYFPASGVYRVRSVSARVPKEPFLPIQATLKAILPLHVRFSTRIMVLGNGKTFSNRDLEERGIEDLFAGPWRLVIFFSRVWRLRDFFLAYWRPQHPL